MEKFTQQYQAVQEYIASVSQAHNNLEQMKNAVIRQFRHTYLFPKLKESMRPYISDSPDSLKYGDSEESKEENWLQLFHPRCQDVHLEWWLDKNDQPGFSCIPNAKIPFYFHIELDSKEKQTALISHIVDYIASSGQLREVGDSLWWNNTETRETLDIEITKTYQKNLGGILRVIALQEINAENLDWLPDLLQSKPVQLLLQLLRDETFWSRPEIKQLIG